MAGALFVSDEGRPMDQALSPRYSTDGKTAVGSSQMFSSEHDWKTRTDQFVLRHHQPCLRLLWPGRPHQDTGDN